MCVGAASEWARLAITVYYLIANGLNMLLVEGSISKLLYQGWLATAPT